MVVDRERDPAGRHRSGRDLDGDGPYRQDRLSSVGAVRLMTWNLSDLDVTAPGMLQDRRVAYLAEVDADVLCLQKVSGEVAPERLDDGLAELATHLGMTGVLGRAAGQRLHVAVLWGDPLRHRGVVIERAHGSRRNHLLVDLWLDVRRLRIGSVHLPSTSVEDQLHDLDLLLCSVDHDSVLAGDWNATSSDASYDVRRLMGDDRRVAARLDAAGLVDAALVAGAAWEPTWRTPDEPSFVRIDTVRLSSAWGGRVKGLRVHTGVDWLSLHRPVEATFDGGAA